MTSLLLNIISLFTFIGMTVVIISNKSKRSKRNNNRCINNYIHKRRF